MKKVFLSILAAMVMLGAVNVSAQETVEGRPAPTFSPGLLSNPVTKTTKTTAPVKKPAKKSRTTVLRFDPEQTALTEAQKEILYKISQRIIEGKTRVVRVIAASSTAGVSTKRVISVESFLRSYERQFQFYTRIIAPENVVSSIDDTVKIIERN